MRKYEDDICQTNFLFRFVTNDGSNGFNKELLAKEVIFFNSFNTFFEIYCMYIYLVYTIYTYMWNIHIDIYEINDREFDLKKHILEGIGWAPWSDCGVHEK